MTIQWSPHARADLRAIDCETAMRILRSLVRILAIEHRSQAYR